MKKVNDYLQRLGLTPIEVKLYLSLLAIGPLTVQELAKSIKINRTAAYPHIDSLIEKGILIATLKDSRKKLTAIEPERLHYLIDNKLENIKSLEKHFPDMLQTINYTIRKPSHEANSKVSYYQGIHNIRKIYDEAFRSKELRSYVKVEEENTLSSDNSALFHQAFVKNKKLKIWEIVYESPFSKKQAIRLLSKNNTINSRYFYKFMPSNLKWSITSEDIIMYDGKVAIINYNDNYSCVLVQSDSFYNNSKELFKFIWSMIPETK